MSATPLSAASFVAILLYSQLLVRIPYPKSDFSGQTIIVTGSNTGLGLEAARHLVRLGASKVILAVRTKAKGEAAAADILASTRAAKNVVEVWELDLSSYDSIKAFGKKVQRLERLDALIQNAGVLSLEHKIINGEEAHAAINVIGAVLLGLLVLPKLRESAKKFNTRTRLSFVGSDGMYIAKGQGLNTEENLFDRLRRKEGLSTGDLYPTSKLFLFYAVREIAVRSPLTPDSNVIINCMTPGMCKSNIFRDDKSWIVSFGEALMLFLLARSTEVGGRTLVHAVKPDLGADAHGAFLMDAKIGKNGASVENAKGQELARKLNAELFAKLEDIEPGVTNVLR